MRQVMIQNEARGCSSFCHRVDWQILYVHFYIKGKLSCWWINMRLLKGLKAAPFAVLLLSNWTLLILALHRRTEPAGVTLSYRKSWFEATAGPLLFLRVIAWNPDNLMKVALVATHLKAAWWRCLVRSKLNCGWEEARKLGLFIARAIRGDTTRVVL